MTGTAIRRLTLTTLKALDVPIPAMDTQVEISRKLTSLNQNLSDLAKQIEISTAVQAQLINQIFQHN